ncbi:MAG: PAS domain-containing protein [Nitrospiraceae bacterium]|nr:PAS domain-containing protein [Nitrospiraceae bacterium]
MPARAIQKDDILAQKRTDKEHERILNKLYKELRPVFLHSPDGVYLYLDDRHKICSHRMAEIFGTTIEEWSAEPDFLESFVVSEDRELFAQNFQEHVATLTRPVTFRFRAVKKDGTIFTAETDMIPLSFEGYALAFHFVREVQ